MKASDALLPLALVALAPAAFGAPNVSARPPAVELPSLDAPSAAGPTPLAAAVEPPSLGPLPADVQAVIDAANALPVVRVFFADAPGFGHQSATLASVRRLRELGFEGRLEAIYEGAQPATAEKLAALLPGFDPASPRPQHVPDLGMTVEPLETFRRGAAPQAGLGLSAGDDFAAADRAGALRVDAYLKLGPTGWRTPQGVWRQDVWTELPGDGMLLHRPSPEDAAASLSRAEAAGSLTAGRAAGLRSLLESAHHSLPVYGLAFLDADGIANLLRGVLLAQESRPDLFGGRGVVLPVLHDMGWKLGDAIRKLGRESRVEWAMAEDEDLPRRLGALKAGQALVVNAGAAPPAAFERFFAQATLPPTLEGKNAASLAGLLGIPFLPVRQNTTLDFVAHVMERDPMRAVEATRLLRYQPAAGIYAHEHGHGVGSGLFDLNLGSPDDIARLIVESLQPESPLRRLFADFRQRLDDFEADKLLRGLQAALSR